MFGALVNARNAYAYPSIGLCASKNLDDVALWQESFEAKTFKSTLYLDVHHTSHLLSKDDDDVLLGIYSVIYWGYITSGGRSKIRCNWLSVGNAKNNQLSLDYISKAVGVKIVRTAAEHIQRGEYAQALLEIRKLPHVGMSFGTKFLAFLDPENVGILDEKITRHLALGSFTEVLGKNTVQQLIKPNNESAIAASQRFQIYCDVLNKIKQAVNKQKLYWQDASGAEMCRFRAIDLERALYAIASNN
jgi:hypothetical protein